MFLTDKVIQNLDQMGRFTDDKTKGLHLWVKNASQKSWVMRYTKDGKRHGMGLGGYPQVGLREAREKAIEARNAVNKGINPIAEKKLAKTHTIVNKAPTFGAFALDYIERMKPKWRNEKHGEQWVSTIQTYAIPIIGKLPLDEIDTPHLLQILEPIWLTKSETASRLRGRLERVISAAITLKFRPTPNPAMWRGHLENLLPTQKPSDKHHEALPYEQVPNFMSTLRDMDSLSALALELTILNASRTGEVLQGKRSEISGAIWTIPGVRMKAGKIHQVPLSQRSLDILTIANSLDPESQFIFSRNSKPLSNMSMLMLVRRIQPGLTVHGFRSTFRDWIAEETEYSPEVAEMSLAHTIANRVERAYRRGNLIEQRRKLMDDWASFCNTGHWGNIINFPNKKSA